MQVKNPQTRATKVNSEHHKVSESSSANAQRMRATNLPCHRQNRKSANQNSQDITEIQNLLSNSKVRNVIHSGRITFRVLTNYIPRLGELQSAVMANYNPRSQARPTP
jgi:hypothetical protein